MADYTTLVDRIHQSRVYVSLELGILGKIHVDMPCGFLGSWNSHLEIVVSTRRSLDSKPSTSVLDNLSLSSVQIVANECHVPLVVDDSLNGFLMCRMKLLPTGSLFLQSVLQSLNFEQVIGITFMPRSLVPFTRNPADIDSFRRWLIDVGMFSRILSVVGGLCTQTFRLLGLVFDDTASLQIDKVGGNTLWDRESQRFVQDSGEGEKSNERPAHCEVGRV